MQGFMYAVTSETSKEEMFKNIDTAIEKAKAAMEKDIIEYGVNSVEALKSSQRLDPMIAHKQRMMIYYGC